MLLRICHDSRFGWQSAVEASGDLCFLAFRQDLTPAYWKAIMPENRVECAIDGQPFELPPSHHAMETVLAKFIQNPILRGFNPDPSICRVGVDYYLATSTFEWFPGVQIHHSRDLVNWRLLTHALRETRLLDLRGKSRSVIERKDK